MSKEVQAAVGTERQFAKQPELPYALRLTPLNVSSGISQSVDYDAQRLASALGAMPQAIGNVRAAIDKRQKENAQTLLNADKILMGKSKEDLQTFNDMSELQHVQGHNLSHNKYAMAILDRAAGQMASTYAKQQWADMPESQKPKSVEEQVHLFQQLLEENRKSFGDGVKNQQAFDEGYYKEGISDTLKVANEADQRINDEKHYKMMMAANVGMQNLIFSGLKGEEFVNNAAPILRQIELGARDLPEFVKAMQGNLDIIASKDIDGSRLKILESMTAFGDTPLSRLMSFAPYKQKIAKNCRKEIARQAYEKYKLPNGGFNWKAYQEDKKNRPADMFRNSIPDVSIPISEGDNPNIENLTPEMQGCINKLGGILYNMGYGGVMQLTSGWRSEEHNREVGGVEGSKHITGDALDVYIGHPSKQQIQQLQQTLSPYFGYVTVHDAGTGTHLHVQQYQGGLDNVENPEDMSYSAYDVDREDAVDNAVMSLYKKDKSAYDAEHKKYYNDALKKAYTAGDINAALEVADDQQLSPIERQKIRNSVNTAWKKREAANSGKLKGLALQLANYEDPTKATNFFTDLDTVNLYNERKKAHDAGETDDKGEKSFTKEEENKYKAVERRLNAYLQMAAKLNNNNWSYDDDTDVGIDYYGTGGDFYVAEPQPPQDTQEIGDTPFTAQLKRTVAKFRNENKSELQIDAFLRKYAKEQHMDYEQLKDLLKEG